MPSTGNDPGDGAEEYWWYREFVLERVHTTVNVGSHSVMITSFISSWQYKAIIYYIVSSGLVNLSTYPMACDPSRPLMKSPPPFDIRQYVTNIINPLLARNYYRSPITLCILLSLLIVQTPTLNQKDSGIVSQCVNFYKLQSKLFRYAVILFVLFFYPYKCIEISLL